VQPALSLLVQSFVGGCCQFLSRGEFTSSQLRPKYLPIVQGDLKGTRAGRSRVTLNLRYASLLQELLGAPELGTVSSGCTKFNCCFHLSQTKLTHKTTEVQKIGRTGNFFWYFGLFSTLPS